MNLLYVEDCPELAGVVCDVLRNKYPMLNVVWVEDGVLAVNEIRHGKTQYSGILTDNNLIELDGEDMAEMLKTVDGLDIPILMFTGRKDGIDSRKLKYLDAVVDKHDIESMLSSIKNLLNI